MLARQVIGFSLAWRSDGSGRGFAGPLDPYQYDDVFERYGAGIPVAYLRALAIKESGLRPTASSGPAHGLLQITDVARRDYNSRHGTVYTVASLDTPSVNVAIGADLLRRIVASYAKHPSANLQTNWENPEFVKLVTMGWNAGWAEGGGVGKVAAYLESRGRAVTHDAVRTAAAVAGGASFLSDDGRYRWQRGVADLYFLQPDRARSFPWGKALLAVGAVGLLLFVGVNYHRTGRLLPARLF